MEPLSKVRINTAVRGRTHMPISSTHITSSYFMALRPVYYRHTLPLESGVVNGSVTTLLRPLGQPIFGRARINLRAFFVPYRLLQGNWDAFITDSPSVSANSLSIPESAPYFTDGDIYTILESLLGYAPVTDASAISAGAYDWSNGSDYYKFTNIGRSIMTIFESLGYRWTYVMDKASDFRYNAFGLLAFLKVWLDWYANSQYMDSTFVMTIEVLLDSIAHSSIYHISPLDLADILYTVSRVGYDSNSYFISAWDSPTAPNPSVHSTYEMKDVSMFSQGANPDSASNSSKLVADGVIGTPYLRRNSTGTSDSHFPPASVTQYSLDALKSLTDFLRRNQLASSRSIDRYLARFGVNLKAENIKRSVYCGFKSVDIEFGQVVSTADTNIGGSSNLGDRAGKGDGHGEFSFEYDTNGEYGIFIVLSSIIPDGSLYQGYDRNNRHLVRTDFWTPEFDSLGTMAIEKGEVLVNTDTSLMQAVTDYSQVFGFAPSYAEYKVGRDFFTGDLRFKSFELGGSAYHLFRELPNTLLRDLVHSLSFTIGNDAAQYNRIFTDTSGDSSGFITVYHFENEVSSPAKSLFDTYEFKDKGDKVTLDTNGVKVN